MLRKRYLLALVFLIQASVAFSQDAPPVDVKGYLLQLQQIQEKRSAAEKAENSKLLQAITSAASSNANAIAFYEEAVRATQFAGQNHESKEFHDWKQKEAANLKSQELQTALRLHLLYLAISLQRAENDKLPALMPSLLNYVNQLSANYPLVWDQPLMTTGIADGVFARWLNLGKTLGKLKDWETSPGNLDGIYEKTLLPQMRKDKDPRIIQYWDDKLNREKDKASKSRLAFNVDNFNLVQRPQLLWSRAEDMLAIGQKNRAMTEMFSIVKNYPDHASAPMWIARLEGLLTGKDNGPVGAGDTTGERADAASAPAQN